MQTSVHAMHGTTVFVDCPPSMSKGIGRVVTALRNHLPYNVSATPVTHSEWDQRRATADVVVFHVVGKGNYEERDIDHRIRECVSRGQPYAMIMYCLKTTENGGDPAYWGPLWDGARCVYSYYDVPAITGHRLSNFYHAPLGVDDVFRTFDAAHVPKLFTVGTSGFIAETEGVLECARASQALGGFHFHLGPDFGLGTRTAHQTGLSDEQVARRWAECHYVAGLRRVEGFELPAAESLCVGSRPVVFDAPHYRFAFGDLASYIPEGSPDEVTAALEEVLATPRPVTRSERDEARARFHWKPLVKEFWRRTL